jgi:DNA-binding GntR family transcriptional regulator
VTEKHSGGDEGTLAERAYDALSRLVLTRQLPSGSVVVEGRLAEQLDISRTPIREAILRLAAEGLLVKQGSRSYAVRQVQPVEFFQALKVRELIEGEAVELAIGRVPPEVIKDLRQEVEILGRLDRQDAQHWEMDDRLHLVFPEALNNGVMVRIIRELRMTTRLFELTSPSGRVARDAREHMDILHAVGEGNPRRARAAMATHLRNVAAEMLDVMSGRDAAPPKRRSRG